MEKCCNATHFMCKIDHACALLADVNCEPPSYKARSVVIGNTRLSHRWPATLNGDKGIFFIVKNRLLNIL